MAKFEKANSVGEWLEQRLNIKALNKVMMTEYWIPKDINFLWAMGVLLATTFTILVISGLFLMMYYKPDINLAFDSVNYTIMQEVGAGHQCVRALAGNAAVDARRCLPVFRGL